MRDDFDPRFDRWERQWRRMEAKARRGFRNFQNMDMNFDLSGLGNLGANFAGWGGNFRIGRMLASGDLRLVALYLIEQQPRHGYEIIKAVEERSMGFYSPSPGIVYPALTYLEEAGYVTSEPDGNKVLYTITDAGREHLEDNREAIDSTLDFLGKAGSRMKDWRERLSQPGWPFNAGERPDGEAGPRFEEEVEIRGEPHRRPEPADRDIRDVDPDVNAARKELKKAIKRAVAGDAAEQARVAAILRRAAAEISNGSDDDDFDL